MSLTDQEKVLFMRAREYSTTGRLPRNVPETVWAGPGTGAVCGLCGHTIEPGQVGYELTGGGGVTFHFHMRCHAIWELAAEDKLSVD